MKIAATFLALVALARMGYAGQTNRVDIIRNAPTAPTPANGNPRVGPRTNSTQRLVHEEKAYGGALTDLRRRKTQFLRAAPGNPNAAFQNVSVNPITGRADGIILFSIGF